MSLSDKAKELIFEFRKAGFSDHDILDCMTDGEYLATQEIITKELSEEVYYFLIEKMKGDKNETI